MVENQEIPNITCYEPNWSPIVSREILMNLFSDKSNPLYDSTCNNEILRMQKMSMENLCEMTGIEYVLLPMQEPISYIIRKQCRISHDSTIPLEDIHTTVKFCPNRSSNLEIIFRSRITIRRKLCVLSWDYQLG